MSKAMPAFTVALIAAGLITNVEAQVQSAGTLFVNVDATGLAEGPLLSITNNGTLGGVFATTADPTNAPVVATIGGTKGMQFDGNDFLQHVTEAGVNGFPVIAPAELTGEDPTRSIEVWAFNPAIAGEETLVSWGRRGGPDGSNISFNYGTSGAFGAVGHWGNRDIGWSNAGGAPAAGRWHHLVYTYDGNVTRVYADGVLANREYLGPGAINTHGDTAIVLGAQTLADAIGIDAPARRLSGAIGRVRVHDNVLTPEQVANNYNVEKSGFIDPVIPEPPVIPPERLTKGPVHRYSFNETAGDATDKEFRDSVATAHGMVLGEGATFTGSRLVLPGGPSATAAYGDLPNGLLSSNGVANAGSGKFSIETWLRLTGARTWSRVWDFGSSGTAAGTEEVLGPGGGGEGRDYLMYSAQVDNNVNSRRLEVRNEDPDDPDADRIDTVDNPTSTFNRDTHLVVTWDEAAGVITAYENGVQVSTLTTAEKMSDINDVNVWLGRSNWVNDQNAQAEFDEVRFYDYVLTLGQTVGNAQAGDETVNTQDTAATIFSQPQSVTVPETSAVTFSFEPSGSSPLAIQWFRDGSPIAGATSRQYTISSVTAADSGAVFTAQASNTVNGQPITVTSSPATLTVQTPTVTLKHRYSFNEAAGSTTVSDSVGGANGTVISAAPNFDGDELILNGTDDYVDLPNGIITALGADATFEVWVTHESPSIWSRIFDFGITTVGEDQPGNGLDFLFLASRAGEGFPRFIANFPGGGDVANLPSTALGWLPGEQHHYAISWSASGNTSRMFVDGVPVSSGIAPQPISNMNNQDVNNWLGRSQFQADAYWGGKYNELRLHTGAMTPSQVAASFAAGPTSLPTALPSLTAQRSGNNLTISWPSSATGFGLESTTALGAGANWTPVTGATPNGNQMQVTVALDGTARFFRLRRP